MIALEEEEGEKGVELPIIFQRVFWLMQDMGWDFIHIGDEFFA